MRDGVKCESESLEYPLGGADVVGVVVVVGRQVGEREKRKMGKINAVPDRGNFYLPETSPVDYTTKCSFTHRYHNSSL